MSTFKKQTYDNSYLFSLPGELDKHHKRIAEFILKAERIEVKTADNFRGIVEDVKRFQKSSILYNILLRDDVVIAYSLEALPQAFKVFSAKDIARGGGNKVFIDVSGLIVNNNGNYTCKDIGKFCTYLFQAITWLLYESNPLALLNNSSVTISATECFVSLFDYLIGYFRFYGYSENRNKILYVAALYFLIRLMGKDDDMYTRNLAAKVSGVAKSSINAYELYYKPEDFTNIDTFITAIAKVFKLKGLTTEVFVAKWIYICGTGTEYAPELFTAFSNMIIGVYCGAYVVPNQKTIEAQTKSNMVKFATSVMKLGLDEFDTRKFMESSELDKTIPRSQSTMELLEKVNMMNSNPNNIHRDSFKDVDVVIKETSNIIEHYRFSGEKDKISSKLVRGFNEGIEFLRNKPEEYSLNSLSSILKEGHKYFTMRDRSSIIKTIDSTLGYLREAVEKEKENNPELSGRLSSYVLELIKCKSIV